jgi:hypothetical protein
LKKKKKNPILTHIKKVRGKECAIKKLKGQELSEEALEEMRKEVRFGVFAFFIAKQGVLAHQ